MKLIDARVSFYDDTITLYFGDDGLTSWHGDDWDDPLDNAGPVYAEFVAESYRLELPCGICAAEDDGQTYGFCSKLDLMSGCAPVIVFGDDDDGSYMDDYMRILRSKDGVRLYMGDRLDDVREALSGIGIVMRREIG